VPDDANKPTRATKSALVSVTPTACPTRAPSPCPRSARPGIVRRHEIDVCCEHPPHWQSRLRIMGQRRIFHALLHFKTTRRHRAIHRLGFINVSRHGQSKKITAVCLKALVWQRHNGLRPRSFFFLFQTLTFKPSSLASFTAFQAPSR
jgi:hypothetical protein